MQYVRECLQLFYWIYFKPYTLKQHVWAICPEITDPYADNFFRRSATAKANPRLQRYDDQGWWLAALVPIAIGLLGNAVMEPAGLWFKWFFSTLFLLGWLFGQIVGRVFRKKEKKDNWIVLSVLLFISGIIYYSEWIDNVLLDAELFLLLPIGIMAAMLSRMRIAGEGVIPVFLGIAVGFMLVISTYDVFSIASNALFVAGKIIDKVNNGDINLWISVFAGINPSLAIPDGITNLTQAFFFGFCFMAVGVLGLSVAVMITIIFITPMFVFFIYTVELYWVLLLKALPVHAVARLRALPTSLDQALKIPLPFLAAFIAEAYKDNQAAARQAIDYLVAFTNQQETAVKAIHRIAIEEFSRCATVSEIVEVRKRLDWLSDPQLDAHSVCLEISQDVTAALEGSSPYRQARQLDRVCEEITRRRNALAAASVREATAFGSVMDSWQRILETARDTLREQARHSDEIPQVYLAGPALDPNKAGTLFKGRRDLFRRIETLTLSAQHPTLVMYGGRRTGKTSTLNYLPQWMPSDILPLLVDAQHLADTITLSGFAEEFADQIVRSARKVHGLRLPSPDSDKLARDPFVALRHWLDAVEQAAGDKTLLICLDEFERLDEMVRATGSRAPLNFLRHLIQHRDRWTLLFAGAHMPEELPDYWSDYLINSQTLRVSYLAKEDTLTLIKEPVEGFPAIYPDEVAEAIWRLTNGQPYFTQLLCHELVEHLNRVKEKIVRMSDLEAVLPVVFERGYQVFREFRDALTEGQRELLLALAEERPPGEEAVNSAPIAPMLVRKEILAQDKGGWSFRVPLLRRWILTKCEE